MSIGQALTRIAWPSLVDEPSCWSKQNTKRATQPDQPIESPRCLAITTCTPRSRQWPIDSWLELSEEHLVLSAAGLGDDALLDVAFLCKIMTATTGAEGSLEWQTGMTLQNVEDGRLLTSFASLPQAFIWFMQDPALDVRHNDSLHRTVS